jgi:hypothetical protein
MTEPVDAPKTFQNLIDDVRKRAPSDPDEPLMNEQIIMLQYEITMAFHRLGKATPEEREKWK